VPTLTDYPALEMFSDEIFLIKIISK